MPAALPGMRRPAAGNKAVKIQISFRDEQGFNADPANDVLGIKVSNSAGMAKVGLFKDYALTTSLDPAPGMFGWSKLEKTGTGNYILYYKVEHNHDLEELAFAFRYQEYAAAPVDKYFNLGTQVVPNNYSELMPILSIE